MHIVDIVGFQTLNKQLRCLFYISKQTCLRGLRRPTPAQGLDVDELLTIIKKKKKFKKLSATTSSSWDHHTWRLLPYSSLLTLANLPPHLTVYNKGPEISGCWWILIRTYSTPDLSFSVQLFCIHICDFSHFPLP